MGDYGTEDQASIDFPDSKSPSLLLTQPTQNERLATWNLNAANWAGPLSLPDYLEREEYLTTVPLARDNGVTHWILVDRNLPPNERPILASCESLRKSVLVSENGVVTEAITHGIGSVFSQPRYRGKGYAARMLRELAPTLEKWQTDTSVPGRETCAFSILYSDIGTKYYAKLGWEVHPSRHIALRPSSTSTITPLSNPNSSPVKLLRYPDLPALCTFDEQRLRDDLATFSKDGKIHVALIPSHEQMQWHHKREDFLTNKLFQKSPSIKGALAGTPGSRVWVIWTRAYYGPLAKPDSGNTLYILRLVLEDESDADHNVESLKAILELAKEEAKDWSLEEVNVWNPSELVRGLVQKTGMEHELVERKEGSIASLMWYGEGSGKVDDIRWYANEKYGWC